jgi:hypothetical protein
MVALKPLKFIQKVDAWHLMNERASLRELARRADLHVASVHRAVSMCREALDDSTGQARPCWVELPTARALARALDSRISDVAETTTGQSLVGVS